jgi:hypothetical protein
VRRRVLSRRFSFLEARQLTRPFVLVVVLVVQGELTWVRRLCSRLATPCRFSAALSSSSSSSSRRCSLSCNVQLATMPYRSVIAQAWLVSYYRRAIAIPLSHAPSWICMPLWWPSWRPVAAASWSCLERALSAGAYPKTTEDNLVDALDAAQRAAEHEFPSTRRAGSVRLVHEVALTCSSSPLE